MKLHRQNTLDMQIPGRLFALKRPLLLMIFTLFAGITSVFAQGSQTRTLTMTLNEAIQIGMENSYLLRNSEFDQADVQQQIDEALGGLYPQISLSSSYTRNVFSPNPFSGSAAGSLFGGLSQLDWLAYNEEARTDNDPSSAPISLQDFRDRQQAGLDEAGIVQSSSDNPFAVPNQFQNSISINQTLFNNAVFQALKGARTLKASTDAGVARQEQEITDQTKVAFYQVLLSIEQVGVLEKSISRTAQTVREASRLVEQGVAPKYQRLTAEVELANLETQLISARNQVELALNNLKMIIGIPVQQPIQLLGTLEGMMPSESTFDSMGIEDAVDTAIELRPDLMQANHIIELQRINREVVRSNKYPIVSAFANVGLSGNVPTNRSSVISDPNDPFKFTEESNGFFGDAYWDPSFAVGIRLNWNLFDGGQTKSQYQRSTLAIDRAELQKLQLSEGVRIQVEGALRNLKTARERISSQTQNLDRAALNYEYAVARLNEGVGSQLEERQASELLDQSSLAYVQAVYDYLVASSAFESALGLSLNQGSDQ